MHAHHTINNKKWIECLKFSCRNCSNVQMFKLRCCYRNHVHFICNNVYICSCALFVVWVLVCVGAPFSIRNYACPRLRVLLLFIISFLTAVWLQPKYRDDFQTAAQEMEKCQLYSISMNFQQMALNPYICMYISKCAGLCMDIDSVDCIKVLGFCEGRINTK